MNNSFPFHQPLALRDVFPLGAGKANLRGTPREKGGSFILFSPTPVCSVTVFGDHEGTTIARGQPTPSVWESGTAEFSQSQNFPALLLRAFAAQSRPERWKGNGSQNRAEKGNGLVENLFLNTALE